MAYSPSRENPYIGYMYEECRRLTECVFSEYAKKGLLLDNGIYENDEVREMNWSKIPVTNMLLGCIKDVEDEQILADQSNWEIMAEGMANGVDLYFEEKV